MMMMMKNGNMICYCSAAGRLGGISVRRGAREQELGRTYKSADDIGFLLVS